MSKYSVLFVCTGNICRSPTADAVFRHMVEEAGISAHFQWDSAGTHDYHRGLAPDHRTIRAAAARGIRIDDLRARCLTPEDFQNFDLILAMDQWHYDIMKKMAPAGCRASLDLFLPYAGCDDCRDVPDPYYGAARDFEHVIDLVSRGVEGLIARLRRDIIERKTEQS